VDGTELSRTASQQVLLWTPTVYLELQGIPATGHILLQGQSTCISLAYNLFLLKLF